MCIGCASRQSWNVCGGVVGSVAISIFFIYEFILLAKQNEITMIYIIVIPLLISKLIALIQIFCFKNKLNILWCLSGFLFSFEQSLCCDSTEESFRGVVYQFLILTIPTNIVNVYLISDPGRDAANGYYVAVIFINYFIFGLLMITVIDYDIKRESNFLINTSSVFLHFSFIYLLAQSMLMNKYIAISLMCFNFLVGVLDLSFLKGEGRKKSIDKYNLSIISYLFQTNTYYFNLFKSQYNYKLAAWNRLVRLTVQCINVIALFILKLNYDPFMSKLDIAFYILFAFSIIPQVYTLILNFYYKLTKANKYEVKLLLNEEELKIPTQAFSLLNDNFINLYRVDVDVKLESRTPSSINSFCKNLTKLKNIIQQTTKQDYKDKKISIKYQNNSHLFSIDILFQYPKSTTISFGANCLSDSEDLEIAKYLVMMIKQDSAGKENMFIIGDSLDYSNVQDFLLKSTTFHNNKYFIYQIKHDTNDYLLLQNTCANIVSNNLQILAFQKNLSSAMTYNPQVILYDLYQDNICDQQ